MPYAALEYLPLSAISNFVFCPRRAALRYSCGLSEINTAMAEGAELHSRIDEGRGGGRGVKQYFRVPVASAVLGLSGILDILEHTTSPEDWRPVEFKHGRLHKEQSWEIQLCAQAIALEETMAGVGVESGDIFYAKSRRRMSVEFTPALRSLTIETAHSLHRLISSGLIPIVSQSSKCKECAMRPACLPSVSPDYFREVI